MFLLKVADVLEKSEVEYAIVGGYAVALHGAVRATVDIDIVVNISKKSFINAEIALNSIDLYSRLPVDGRDVFNFRNEYIKNRNMIAWNFINSTNPSESVDILITEDLKKKKVKRIAIGNQTIKVVSLDDLIKMKGKSSRPQDMEDVKSLRKLK